jgi:hypothetical protein
MRLKFQTRDREGSGEMHGRIEELEAGKRYALESGVLPTDSGQMGAMERLSTASTRVSLHSSV